MPTETKPLRMMRLEVEDFKRITAVAIDFDAGDDLVEIAGENGAGKTSVQDAWDVLMEGAGALPETAVRQGEKRWRITGYIGDGVQREYRCTMSGTESSRPSLEVTRLDGQALGDTDRAFITALTGGVPFDPEEFARMEPKDQRAMLMRLVKLDFGDLDAEEARIRKDREALAKPIKAAKGAFESAEFHQGVPEECKSSEEVTKRLQEAIDSEAAFNASKQELETVRQRIAAGKNLIAEWEQEIAKLNKRVEDGRKQLAALQAEETKIKDREFDEVDVQAIRAELSTIDTVNDKVRQNQRRAELKKSWDDLQKQHDDYSKRLTEIEAEKKKLAGAAKFPFSGLGITDVGVTLDGVPFEQGSDAQKVLAATAIYLGVLKAEGRRVRHVNVRKGSLISRSNKQRMREMLRKAGATCIFEVVDATAQTKWIIEAGRARPAKQGPEASPAEQDAAPKAGKRKVA